MVIKRSAEIRHVVAKVLIRPFCAVRQSQGSQAQRSGRGPLAGDQSLGSDAIIRNADPPIAQLRPLAGVFQRVVDGGRDFALPAVQPCYSNVAGFDRGKLRRATMRVAVAVAAALAASMQAASAQGESFYRHRYCASSAISRGQLNCAYDTYAQCMRAPFEPGRYCTENPFWRGRQGPPPRVGLGGPVRIARRSHIGLRDGTEKVSAFPRQHAPSELDGVSFRTRLPGQAISPARQAV